MKGTTQGPAEVGGSRTSTDDVAAELVRELEAGGTLSPERRKRLLQCLEDATGTLTVPEAAQELGCHPTLVHHYVRDKRGTKLALPATKLPTGVGAGKYVIERDAFETWRTQVWEKIRRERA